MLRFLYEGSVGELLAPSGTDSEQPFLAAAHGKLTILEKFLCGGLDPDSKNASGNRLLHVAAANGQLECCALLLDRGADLEAWGRNATTPLLVAVRRANDAVAMLLLAYGANPVLASTDGDSPLSVACRRGNLDLVKKMIECNVPLSLPSPGDGSTPLHVAARAGHADVVRALLDAGADPTTRADNDESARDVAATDECRTLLEAAAYARIAWLSPPPGAPERGYQAEGGGARGARRGGDEDATGGEGDESGVELAIAAVAAAAEDEGAGEGEGADARGGGARGQGTLSPKAAEVAATHPMSAPPPTPSTPEGGGRRRRKARRQRDDAVLRTPRTPSLRVVAPAPTPDMPSSLLDAVAAGGDVGAAPEPWMADEGLNSGERAGGGALPTARALRFGFDDMIDVEAQGAVRAGPPWGGGAGDPSPRGDAGLRPPTGLREGGGGAAEAGRAQEGQGEEGGAQGGKEEEEEEEEEASRLWQEHERSVRRARWESELERASGLRRPPPGVRAAAAVGMALGSLTHTVVEAGKKRWSSGPPPAAQPQVREVVAAPAVAVPTVAAPTAAAVDDARLGPGPKAVGPAEPPPVAEAPVDRPRPPPRAGHPVPGPGGEGSDHGWMSRLNAFGSSLRGAVADVQEVLASEPDGLVAREEGE